MINSKSRNSTDILQYQNTSENRTVFDLLIFIKKTTNMNLIKTCFLLSCLFCAVSLFGQEKTVQSAPGPLTEISFDGPIFNYGSIESGEIVQTVFTFENTGQEPLIIVSAKGSCGCTVPEWPKEPIAPGESGQLVVRFNSKNKVGMQSKRVTITANTNPAHSYLTVKGEVRKAELKSEEILKELAKTPFNLVDIDATDVLIYPNPTSDQLNVKIDNLDDSKASVFLYDLTGKLIESQQITKGSSNEIKFGVSDLQSGTYTVTIKAEGKHRIAKQVSIIH